jgi:hypothetical protein
MDEAQPVVDEVDVGVAVEVDQERALRMVENDGGRE